MQEAKKKGEVLALAAAKDFNLPVEEEAAKMLQCKLQPSLAAIIEKFRHMQMTQVPF